MVRINPSIFAADPLNLANELQRIASADYVHVDVMDNHFVPNMSFGANTVSQIASFSPVPLDVHLMVEDPERWVASFIQSNVGLITFHAEATTAPVELARTIRESGVKAGIALRPNTRIDGYLEHLTEFDQIVVMTIEPGFGGQPMIPKTLRKLKELRMAIDQTGKEIWLQVDGGVNKSTIGLAREYGADTFAIGSAIFQSKDPAARIAELRAVAQSADVAVDSR